MNKLSRYIQVFGIAIIISSLLRWFFIYYDPSQAVLGIAIGIIFVGFADIYNARTIQEDKIKNNSKRIDSFVHWMSKEEMK